MGLGRTCAVEAATPRALSLTYDRLVLVADAGLTIFTYTAEAGSRHEEASDSSAAGPQPTNTRRLPRPRGRPHEPRRCSRPARRGRAVGLAKRRELSGEQVSRSSFTAQVRAVSRRSSATRRAGAALPGQLCASAVDYNCKQRPERHVIGELRHERQGVDCWEPAANNAHVDDPDRESSCCTPSNRPASRQRSGQHLPARGGDADMDDGAAREPTAPGRK